MATQPEPSLEQTLPEGQLVNRAWLRARGFNRPRVDYALRAGKLTAVAHGIYRRPGPALKWEHVVYSLNQMGLPGARGRPQRPGVAGHGPLSAPGRIPTHRSLRRGQGAHMGGGVSDVVSIYDSHLASV